MNKSGLVYLATQVKNLLTARAYAATVAIGWREHARQPVGTARIVFTPDIEGGRGGRITQPQQAGNRTMSSSGRHRALRDWERQVSVHCWGHDVTHPNDESLQIEAAESVLEEAVRAIHSVAGATIRWGDVLYQQDPTERRAGCEISAQMTLIHPIFGWDIEVAHPAAAAVSKEES